MRRLAMFLLLALFAAGCGSSGGEDANAALATATVGVNPTAVPTKSPDPTSSPVATAEPVPEPTATTPPTPEPAPTVEPPTLELVGDGPYQVGAATVTVNADSDRPLTVAIWFPLDESANPATEAARYTFITGDYYESVRAVEAAAADIAGDGPFPLVVYSHGSGGIRFVHSDYTEVLASHGYVVAAPDHTGNTAVEQFLGIEDDLQTIASNRPIDVISVIDAMTNLADEATAQFASAVDAERIAVTGHSFGGFTSYAVVSGYENEVGSSRADDRVDAIITLAPAVGPREGPTLLSDEALGAVDVPALVMVGTDDKTTPADPNVDRAWELTMSSPHYRLELDAAEHQSFTDVCNYVAAFEAGQEVTEPVRQTIDAFAEAACAPGDMPIERVQDLTNTFAIRFLDSVFGDGEMINPAAADALDDVIYEAK